MSTNTDTRDADVEQLPRGSQALHTLHDLAEAMKDMYAELSGRLEPELRAELGEVADQLDVLCARIVEIHAERYPALPGPADEDDDAGEPTLRGWMPMLRPALILKEALSSYVKVKAADRAAGDRPLSESDPLYRKAQLAAEYITTVTAEDRVLQPGEPLYRQAVEAAEYIEQAAGA